MMYNYLFRQIVSINIYASLLCSVFSSPLLWQQKSVGGYNGCNIFVPLTRPDPSSSGDSEDCGGECRNVRTIQRQLSG